MNRFMYSKSKKVTNLTDFMDYLGKSTPEKLKVSVYRGHSDKAYKLQPSLFRNKNYRKVEKNILRELIAIQPQEFREDKTSFEQLVRMQHYGLPTRLLDFTYNPLVGLFFACSNIEKDGELVRFNIPKSQIKYFDSDTVSCISNLSNLTGRQRDEIRNFSNSEKLHSSDVGERLLHFIKAEKSYFLQKIEINDLKSIFAVRPKQTNQRILAQQGGFFIFGLRSLLKDQNAFDIEVERVQIPSDAKTNILNELDGININPSTLFPEIESAAKYIMSKIPISSETDETEDS